MAILILGLLIPIALWLAVTFLSNSLLADRSFAWHPPAISNLKGGFNVIVSWLWGTKIYGLIRFFLFLTVLVILFRISKKWAPTKEFIVIGLTLICYLATILIAMIFVDANTQLNYKILFPGLAIFLLLILTVGRNHSPSLSGNGNRILKVIFAAAILFGAIDSYSLIRESRLNGLGISSNKWLSDKAIEYVIKNPQTYIYTNAPEAIQYHLKKRPFSLPTSINKYSLQEDNNFQKNLSNYLTHNEAGSYSLVLINSKLEMQVNQELNNQKKILSSELFHLYHSKGVNEK
jgi:hypothetical protein